MTVDPVITSIYADRHQNMPWLGANTIFLARHGSFSYGLNTPTSDLDIRGVALAPASFYLGYSNVFEQAQGGNKNETPPMEYTVFELKKFLKLASDSNPNVLELLFVDDTDVLYSNRYWELLRSARSLFLSKLAKFRFMGYAVAQLKRIETHRKWLLSPPTTPPTRASLGLPEKTVIPADQREAAMAAIQKQLDKWTFKDLEGIDPATRQGLPELQAETIAEMKLGSDAQFQAAGKLIGFDANMMEVLEAERKFHTAQKQWDSYQTWVKTRNPARAELEAKSGYDSKHGMHLVRLILQCKEILTKGTLTVKQTGEVRDVLMSIRNGAWSYDELVQYAKDMSNEMESVYDLSPLPRSPDRESVDGICQHIIALHLSLSKT